MFTQLLDKAAGAVNQTAKTLVSWFKSEPARTRRSRTRCMLRVEVLDDRVAPAIITWTGAGAALVAIVRNAKAPVYLRSKAARALGKTTEKKETAGALIELFQENPRFVLQTEAQESLIEIGHEAVAPLIALLRSSDELVRIDAMQCLERMQPAANEALPALRQIAADKKDRLRMRVQQTIDKIEKIPKPRPLLEQ